MTNTNNGNAENLALVREAMKSQVPQIADMVAMGGSAEHTEYIDYTSEMGITYRGNIVFKRPNMKDTMLIGGIKSKYFSDAGIIDLDLVDTPVRALAHVMAHLKVVVVKSPPWFFDIDNISDVEIIYEVYEKYNNWNDTFRKSVPSTPDGDSEASEDTENLDS